MALGVSGLSAYTDENKMELIKKSVLEGRTLEYVTVQPDIKSSATINIIDSTLVAAAGSCGFTNAGTTELTQEVLSVDAIKINESICVDTLEKYYTQKMMKPGSYNEEIPFEQMYAEEKAGKINSLIEDIVWNGDKGNGAVAANLQLADGLLKAIDNASGVIDGNVGSETSITAANVIDIVDGMVGVIPTDIIAAEDLVLFMGYDAYRTYAKALRDANLFAYDGAEGKDFSQMVPGTNVKVVAVKGLNGSNRMVLSTTANLYVGVDMLNDAEEFKIFYSQDNDEVRFISKFKLGAQVAFGAFVVEFSL